MARIPEAEIERLKEAVPVERLVEASGIDLKKGGKDLLGRCPFHEDDTASLVVTPGKNLWHCFGCGVGGGPIDWVMKRQGVSLRHAVELLRTDVAWLLVPSQAGADVRGCPRPWHSMPASRSCSIRSSATTTRPCSRRPRRWPTWNAEASLRAS